MRRAVRFNVHPALATVAALCACTTAPIPSAMVANPIEPTTEASEDRAPARDAGVERAREESLDASEPDSSVAGLRADYFDEFFVPKLSRIEPPPSFEALDTAPGPGLTAFRYSVRWSGTLDVPEDGARSFTTSSDDGVRLFVDGELLIDDWTIHSPRESTRTRNLSRGAHTLRIDYFQYTGPATLKVLWGQEGGPMSPLPLDRLTPASESPKDATGAALGPPRPTFRNPVVPFDCPDPGVVRVDGARASYAMACTGGSFRVRQSDDLVSWSDTSSVILAGGKASWSANGGRNWAPEIHKVGSGYVAYFTAVNDKDRLSIGAASAPSATGPWTVGAAPLVEDPRLGLIDATYFEDGDGKRYLYWKIDGNAVGEPTPILVRELAPDGLSFAAGSRSTEVLRNDPTTWEGGVVEAPWVVKRQGQYFLFYSGNVYDYRYRTGVARAASPRGPFTKLGAPVLANNAQWVGPGHGSVVAAHGTDWFLFHAWPAVANGRHDGSKGRHGVLAPIVWADGWPKVEGGSVPTDLLPIP